MDFVLHADILKNFLAQTFTFFLLTPVWNVISFAANQPWQHFLSN